MYNFELLPEKEFQLLSLTWLYMVGHTRSKLGSPGIFSLGCHCPIPIKLKGISCLKPSRAFAFTGSTPLEFLHLDASKEEDGTSLVDLELGCRGLGVIFFFNKTSKIRGVGASSL